MEALIKRNYELNSFKYFRAHLRIYEILISFFNINLNIQILFKKRFIYFIFFNLFLLIIRNYYLNNIFFSLI